MTTPWLDADELAAWKNVSLMHLQLGAYLAKRLGPTGLSFQDYLVLATLSDQPDGQRRVVELSRELGWEKSRASHHITRMCARGLVTKVPHPTDQRGANVVITKTGRAAIAKAAPRHVADVRDAFLDLVSKKDLATMRSVATTVLARLEQLDRE